MKFPKSLIPCLLATLAIGIVWLFKEPTDQELLANAAKAMDFHPWSGWWMAKPDYNSSTGNIVEAEGGS